MPFDPTNALAIFHALVNDILKDSLNVFVYLDDILIYNKTKEQHIQHVKAVY